MPPLERETLNPDSVALPLGAYSNAVKVNAGSLLYIAGQVGVDPQGNLVGPRQRWSPDTTGFS